MKFAGDRPPLRFLGIDELCRQGFQLGAATDKFLIPPLSLLPKTKKVKNTGERQNQSAVRAIASILFVALVSWQNFETSPGLPRPVVDCSKVRFSPMFPGYASVAEELLRSGSAKPVYGALLGSMTELDLSYPVAL